MQGLIAEDVNTVLCFGAHADDIEIGCGGTVLRLLDANPQLHVHWCVFSGGVVREREARESAKRFLAGAERTTVDVFNFRDSYFPDQWARIKETVSAVSEQTNPDLIFSHRLEDRHQDHRVIAELTWCAFRDHLILEYEIQTVDGGLGQPNFYAPLSDRVRDSKIATILECFVSQTDKAWFDAELFRALMRLRGSECHADSGYAEAFHCRKVTFQVLARG